MPGAASAHNVGTVFLQVVPSYANFVRNLRRDVPEISRTFEEELGKDDGKLDKIMGERGRRAGEAFGRAQNKAIGRELGAGGGGDRVARNAGRKAGKEYEGAFQTEMRKISKNLHKEINAIRLEGPAKDMQVQFEGLKRQAKEISETRLFDDKTSRASIANLKSIEKEVDLLRHKKGQFGDQDFFNLTHVARQAHAASKMMDDIFKKQKFELDVDTAKAAHKLGAFEQSVRRSLRKATDSLGEGADVNLMILKRKIENLDAKLELETNIPEVMAETARLKKQLDRVSRNKHVEIHIRSNAAEAAAEMEALSIATKHAQKSNRGMARESKRAGDSAGGAANAFRAFSGIILIAASVGSALIPILAAVGAGIAALGPLLIGAGAGLGVMILGFSGIGAAVKALGDQEKNAAKDTKAASDTMRGALRSVADAERGLSRAREDAAERVKDSERAVTRARQSAAEAAKAADKKIVAARQSASAGIAAAIGTEKRSVEQLTQSKKNAVDAELALMNAKRQAKADQAGLGDKVKQNKLDERQGVISLFEATVSNNATQADGASTKLDKERAKIALAQAKLSLKEIREEQKKLAKEKAKSDKQGVDGSDKVRAAQEQLTQALKDQKDAQLAVGKAAKGVDRARIDGAKQVKAAMADQARIQQNNARNIADAMRSQHRTQVDSVRSISDAQRTLTRAQQDYQSALTKTGVEGSTSMQSVADAMGKLSPAGKAFARYLDSLRSKFYKLRAAAQEGLLPGVQSGMELLIDTYFPSFLKFVGKMSRTMGNLFKLTGQLLTDKVFHAFFATFDKLSPIFARLFGKTTLHWLEFFARSLTITAPLSLKLAEAWERWSKAVANYAKSAKGTATWRKFMAYAAKVGPSVGAFFKQLGRALVNIGIALSGFGLGVLKALTSFFKWIGDADPKHVALVAKSIIAMVLAFQGLAAIKGLVDTTRGLLAGGMWAKGAVAIFLVVAGLVALYHSSKTFRNIVKPLGKAVVHLTKVWKPLAAILGAIVGYFATLKIISGVTFLIGLMGDAIAVLTSVWGILTAAFVASPIGWIVIAIAAAIAALVIGIIVLYKHSATAKRIINGAFHAIGAAGKWLWKKVKPVFHAIGHIFGVVAHALHHAWKTYFWPIISKLGEIVWKMWALYFLVVFKLLKLAWKGFSAAVSWAWKHVFKPIFGWIGDRFKDLGAAIKWVYNHTLAPVLNKLMDLVGGKKGLKSVFDKAVDGIKKIWTGLKAIFKAPVKFLVDVVLNKGIIAGFDWIVDKVAGKKSPLHIDPLKLPGFRRGGIPSGRNMDVYPGYTPGRDTGFIGIGGGEGIMRPEWTRVVGKRKIEEWNSAARTGGVGGVRRAMFGGGFSRGGVVDPDRRVYMDGKPVSLITKAQILLAERLAKASYRIMQGSWQPRTWYSGTSHSGPGVVDVAPGNFSTQSWLRKVGFAAWGRNFPGAHGAGSGAHVHAVSRLDPGAKGNPQLAAFDAGQDGLGGRDYGPNPPLIGNLRFLLSQFKHLNEGGFGAGGAHKGGGIFSKVFGWIGKKASAIGKAVMNPIGFLKDRLVGPLKSLVSKFGDNPFTKMIAKVPAKMFGALKDAIMDKINPFHKKPIKIAFDPSGLGMSIGRKANRGIVKNLASRRGWGSGPQWKALDSLINSESGYDNLAQNPTSTARGMFQFLNSTWGSVGGHKTDNPVAQTRYGMRYIDERYGSPLKAWQFHKSHGYYSKGGVVPDGASEAMKAPTPTIYDTGGYVPPGLSSVLNLSGGKEMIHTPEQLAERDLRGSRSGPLMENHFTQSDLSAGDVVDDLMHASRRLRISGFYDRSR